MRRVWASGAALTVLMLGTMPQALAQRANADLAAAIEINAPGAPAAPDAMAAATVAFPDGIVAHGGVIYAAPIGYRPLTLDIYTPAAKGGAKRPLIIYVHGGAWLLGNPREAAAYRDWPAILAAAAAQGYVVASVSYRFAREAPLPAQIRDVKTAIRFLRTHADDYGIDPARVGIWGDSAGGHLIGLEATTCGVAEFEPVVEAPRWGAPPVASSAPPPSDCVQAAVGWYGIYDLLDEGPVKRPTPPPDDAVRLLLGCAAAPCTDAQKRAASPITYVDAGDAPMLLLHGSDDMAVPPKQSESMAAALKAAGVAAQVRILSGANHAWYGKTPEATRDANREAMRLTLDFFDAQLKPKPAR
jgi:acetyl esterase/lipase